MELLAAFDGFKALLTLMMWGVAILLGIGLVSRLRDDEGSEGALAEQIESEGFSSSLKRLTRPYFGQ